MFDVRSVSTDDTNSECGSTFNINPRQLIVEESTPTVPSHGPPHARGMSSGGNNYYPTSSSLLDDDQNATSADEADNLMDDEDRPRFMKAPGHYRHYEDKHVPSYANQSRSAERGSNAVGLPKSNYQGTPSVESLPDSGLESLREEENIALKKKIADLKLQLEVRFLQTLLS